MIIRVVDTETCGFPPDNGQVCEIATLDLVNENGVWKRGPAFSTLVNPGREIPPEASAVHHITDDMVRDAPPLDGQGVLDRVWLPTDDMANCYAAHEARFEKSVLPMLADGRWICSRKGATIAWPEAPNYKNQTLRYWLRLKLADPALATPHRAAGDCYVTGAILCRILNSIGMPVDDLLAISANPVLLSRFPFGKHEGQPMQEVPTSYLDWIVNKSDFDDEDVLYTARKWLGERRRNRSPV